MIAVDSSKDLVLEYMNKGGLISAHLTTVVSEVAKIFGKLPLNIDKFSCQKEEEKKKESTLTFSSTKKRYEMLNIKFRDDC